MAAPAPAPAPVPAPVTGRHWRYPDLTGGRLAEGGRRLGEAGPPRGRAAGLVTVITVCRNAAATIGQTLASVAAQTYAPIEHLVIDGASTDGTVEILRAHEGQIGYFVSEPDTGLYVAMNKGLALAHGQDILILNADDWYEPDAVEALVAHRRATRADVVSGGANYVDAAGRFLRLQPAFAFDGNALFMMPLRHETMLVPHRVYDRVGGFDTDYRIIADRAFTQRLYEMGHTHALVPRALMQFRDTGVSTVELDALRAERQRLVAATFPILDAAEARALAELEALRPDRLEAIVARHRDPRLARAAADLVRDRQSRGDVRWLPADPDRLEAAGQGPSQGPVTGPVTGPAMGAPWRLPRGRRMLRVATFVTSDHGGAGLGSQRRIEALRRAGIDARLYCLFRNSAYPHVETLVPNLSGAATLTRPEIQAAWRARAVLTRAEAPGLVARELFSKPGAVVDLAEARDIVAEADIVHLHWSVGILDYATLGTAFRGKPVVWTLADMNAFTGGCHYSEGCEGYSRDCGPCPLLGGSFAARAAWRIKHRAYAGIERLDVVCPSDWLAERARQSTLFAGRQVHVIPNALPVHRFRPMNRLVARRRLGLPLDRKLILFGADDAQNRRKGGDLLVESIARLKETGRADGVEGICFGANALDFGLVTHRVGHIADEARMALVYAAADVFAFPSREDNAPLTVVEAMLSGTPVVAFPVGNVPELIAHRETGYVAAEGDIADFAAGLAWALADAGSMRATLRGLLARAAAARHNDPETAAARHAALYESLLEANETGGAGMTWRQSA